MQDYVAVLTKDGVFICSLSELMVQVASRQKQPVKVVRNSLYYSVSQTYKALVIKYDRGSQVLGDSFSVASLVQECTYCPEEACVISPRLYRPNPVLFE